MSTPEIVVASCLVVLALAHSALGESDILRPLFAADWSAGLPRWAHDRILRFAWHLTSMTWLALAAIVAGVGVLPVVGAMSFGSAALIFGMLRGHLAWPIFLLAGLAAMHADGRLSPTLLGLGVGVAVAALVVASFVHIYWAGGGTWMRDRAVPPVSEGGFSPGPVMTLAVAGALATFAALVVLRALEIGPAVSGWLVAAGVGVLTIRAIGDTKVAGFTKSVRGTEFAIADDQYFTPIIVFIALGASAALLL